MMQISISALTLNSMIIGTLTIHTTRYIISWILYSKYCIVKQNNKSEGSIV